MTYNIIGHWPNTVELDKSILAIIVIRLLYTSGFNVRFKNRFGSIIFSFQFSKTDGDVW